LIVFAGCRRPRTAVLIVFAGCRRPRTAVLIVFAGCRRSRTAVLIARGGVRWSRSKHPLNEVASPWTNPWHAEPPRWQAVRGSTVAESEIEHHKQQAADHTAAHAAAHAAKCAEQAATAAVHASERSLYNSKNFIGRAYHDSKPHLRAADPIPRG
jgi:hypothetical protein